MKYMYSSRLATIFVEIWFNYRDNLEGQKSLGPLKISLEMAHKAGLEKTRVFKKKKPAQWVFGFFWVFLGFFGFFWGFFGFFCPEKRVLGVFSVSRILLGASRL